MIRASRLPLRTGLLLFWSLPLATAAGLLALRATGGPGPSALHQELVILGVVFAVGALGLCLLLRQAARDVRSMADTVEAVGRGQYATQVRVQACGELDDLAVAIDRMAKNVAATVAVVTSQKEEIRAVLNGMREGVMVLDSDCRIRRVNRAMERILPGVGERLGRSPLEMLPSPELLDACRRLIDGSGQTPSPLLLVLDERRIYEVNVLPASEASGLGAIAVFHDVSEIKRLESVRRDFAANVSHELRTPLTSIKGYAETLLGDAAPPPEMASKFLRVILRNADHMSKMIGDLLSLARLEAGGGAGNALPGVAMDPRTSLRRAWESIQVLAETRKITLQDDMPECLPRVLADEDQLCQVFRNLLENALKFGPEARPVLVRAHSAEGFLHFTVRDFGPGIPKKDQPRIFERFYSVEKHRRNEYGSTGLGLAIARHIVHNHGGTIRVESPPAGHLEGTAFTFSLPLA
ncbi:MAG: ATP-binding protein [Desulfovibrio sp.]